MDELMVDEDGLNSVATAGHQLKLEKTSANPKDIRRLGALINIIHSFLALRRAGPEVEYEPFVFLIGYMLAIGLVGGLAWGAALYFGASLALAGCVSVASIAVVLALVAVVTYVKLMKHDLWLNPVPIFLQGDDHTLKPGRLAKWLARLLNNRVFITVSFCLIVLSLLVGTVLPFLMVTGVFPPAALLLFSFTGVGAIVAVTATFAGVILVSGMMLLLLSLPPIQELIKQTIAEKKVLGVVSILFTAGAVAAIPLACFLAGFISPVLGVAGTMLFFTIVALTAAPIIYLVTSRALGAIAVFFIRAVAALAALIFKPENCYVAAGNAANAVNNGKSISTAINENCQSSFFAKCLAWVMFGYHYLIAVIQGSNYQTELKNPGFCSTYCRMETVFKPADTAATKAIKVLETVLGYSFDGFFDNSSTTESAEDKPKYKRLNPGGHSGDDA